MAWVFVLLGAGCATSPETGPATRPAPAPASDADVLARRALAHHGALEDVASARFTFVVVADGEERVRRSFDVDFTAETLAVTLPEGAVRFSNLDGAISEAARDPAAGAELLREVTGVEAELAAKAWGAWINDWFWLVAPSKVFDDGTERSVDEEGRLVVRYTSGGVTPGDTYRFTVDDEGRVTAWSYTLGSGREGAAEWSDEAQRGPLRVSLTRRAGDRDVVLRFEDVEIRSGAPLNKSRTRGTEAP